MIEVGSQEEGGLYMTTPARCPEKHGISRSSFGCTQLAGGDFMV